MTFETRTKKKDDELLFWLIGGGIFTLFLLGIDIGYSSFNEMSKIYCWATLFLHFVLCMGWVIALVKFNDPNWDWARKIVCVLAVILCCMVGIHHASVVENNQVQINSKENAIKK